MSARTPFHFNDQPQSVTANSGPKFIPNSANPLHHGSGQVTADSENTPLGLGANKPLPIGGLLGRGVNRTGSHGPPAPKSLLQIAADLSRPQTTAPSNHHQSGMWPKQPLTSINNGAHQHQDRIMTPVPMRPMHGKPAVLTSPTGSFKTPALPPHIGASSPEQHLSFSGAHISSDLHHQMPSGGGPIRQQPSPDSSDQSGVSDDPMQGDPSLTGSFRTSTPHAHGRGRVSGFDAPEIRPQRVFPQEYDTPEDYHHYYAQHRQQQPIPTRKRSRERYSGHDTIDNDQIQPAKRPRNSHDLQMRTNAGHLGPASIPVPADDGRHLQANATHQCVLGKLLSCDADRLLRNQVEHFGNRVSIWQAASDEEWKDGAEELKQRFNAMLDKTQEYMKRKQDLITTLEGRITAHQELLQDREEALLTARENLVNESQNVLGKKGCN
ncbi:hypothetical protein P691DRAFT_774465 [Macrolepiota fuliginosa MF-IS2]|uniref:Extracellular mutant protein 11 C-terminal domain-containing protein n=1 Tax=Macrolepiota fuliginosa MF-IS2 TaxID=1400762 RepID=A0A9P6C2M9_9AGAR|nr:hypothetical protein P691DRAFT_774465 [Macrolepiota fuliginosa MF-IS2]